MLDCKARPYAWMVQIPGRWRGQEARSDAVEAVVLEEAAAGDLADGREISRYPILERGVSRQMRGGEQHAKI